jgi:hypothetical protein
MAGRLLLLLVALLSALLLTRASQPSAIAADPLGVITLRDAKSRTRVRLVGSMHFNPHSIALAQRIVAEEASAGGLRAVAVESCPTRWNATLRMQPAGSLLRSLCDNEMQAAAEAAEAAGAVTALVDQTIEDTGARVRQIFGATLAELCTPWDGGWSRILEDLTLGCGQVLSSGGLGLSSILDPRLLLGFPVSLGRYPLSIGIKSPLVGAAAVALLFLVSQGEETPPPATELEQLLDIAESLAFVALESIILGRVLLVALLEERNYVLARNIRKACLAKSASPDGAVVAVLGMAHLNGVGSLLRDSRIV